MLDTGDEVYGLIILLAPPLLVVVLQASVLWTEVDSCTWLEQPQRQERPILSTGLFEVAEIPVILPKSMGSTHECPRFCEVKMGPMGAIF